eukprot:SAG31_NODE_3374_length_4350_cov_4.769162_3_plen_163_part_00
MLLTELGAKLQATVSALRVQLNAAKQEAAQAKAALLARSVSESAVAEAEARLTKEMGGLGAQLAAARMSERKANARAKKAEEKLLETTKALLDTSSDAGCTTQRSSRAKKSSGDASHTSAPSGGHHLDRLRTTRSLEEALERHRVRRSLEVRQYESLHRCWY